MACSRHTGGERSKLVTPSIQKVVHIIVHIISFLYISLYNTT